MLIPSQRRAVKQIGLMLASITNESNLALTFQILGIQIVMTGPGIERRFGGRNWIGRLRILKSVKHKIKTLADARLKRCDHLAKPAQEVGQLAKRALFK